jgi:hypothetical protein
MNNDKFKETYGGIKKQFIESDFLIGKFIYLLIFILRFISIRLACRLDY